MSRRWFRSSAWALALLSWLAYLLVANRLAILALGDDGDVVPRRGRSVSVQAVELEAVVESLEIFGKSLLDKTEIKGWVRWADSPSPPVGTSGTWHVEWVFAGVGDTYRAQAHIRPQAAPGFAADVRAMVIPVPLAPGTYRLGLSMTDGEADLAFGWTGVRLLQDRRGWRLLP